MPDYGILTELLDLPNVQITHYQRSEPNRVTVFIESTQAAALCPKCQRASLTVHDTSPVQIIRDLPIWNRACWLSYTPRRFACATCQHTFVERVGWREPGSDYTVRYEEFIFEQVRRESVTQVAHDEHMSEDIIQGIFEHWAKKR